MVLSDLIAGTFAGFGICAVGHPFDTLKVLLQTQPENYKGMGDAFRQTVKAYGFGGLYRGVASPLVGMGIFNAVQFAVFGWAKALVTDNGAAVTPGRIAAAAAGTGIVVAFVESPQDLFKCQMQSAGVDLNGKPRYASTADCVRTIVRERGYAGTMQGVGATIARNLVGVTAYFYFYEVARLYMAGGAPVSSLSPLQVMLAGGLGGVGYWVLCYPFDIVKSAVQCDSIHPESRKYKSECVGGRGCAPRTPSLHTPHPFSRTPRAPAHARRRNGRRGEAVGRGRVEALLRGPCALPRALLPRQRGGFRRVRGNKNGVRQGADVMRHRPTVDSVESYLSLRGAASSSCFFLPFPPFPQTSPPPSPSPLPYSLTAFPLPSPPPAPPRPRRLPQTAAQMRGGTGTGGGRTGCRPASTPPRGTRA
jgi:solute carrier family 25 carnitine/acylcarnitine transporter 20/29